jgi:hypothetical protein
MMARIGTSYSKFNVMKFDGSSNFGLWQRHVNDLLVQQGMMKVLYRTKLDGTSDIDWKELKAKTVAIIQLCLGDDVIMSWKKNVRRWFS